MRLCYGRTEDPDMNSMHVRFGRVPGPTIDRCGGKNTLVAHDPSRFPAGAAMIAVADTR